MIILTTMEVIDTSIFDLFKPGPGPSSSHTIGPMMAGLDFYRWAMQIDPQTLQQARALRVTLFGSLSATGKGHGTDRAVVAGLLGWQPDRIDPDAMDVLLTDDMPQLLLHWGPATLTVNADCVVFGPVEHDYPYNNTLVIAVCDDNRQTLFERTYFSTGGGFIQWQGQAQTDLPQPPHPFRNMTQLLEIHRHTGMSIPQIILANQQHCRGQSPAEIDQQITQRLQIMTHAVERGLATRGQLPGPIGLHRKAARLLEHADRGDPVDRTLCLLNAYALAVAEENAAGHIVVTAPTLGSCGVIPAICYLLQHDQHVDQSAIRRGMITAAAVGMIAKHNASIAGAEVGCQGEIGVASAMAAALLAEVRNQRPVVIANAAEIALEHHLGMTCDPVGGYVQIPCIERNAMGAVKALNAVTLASNGEPAWQKVNFDQVVQVMLSTGRDMSCKYKETSEAGLALSLAQC